MSQEKKLLLAIAGAGALGAALYTTQGSGDKSANKTRDKKNMGLEGAGIAGTGAAGGNERAVDPSEDKKVKTTAPRDKLPSGGTKRRFNTMADTNPGNFANRPKEEVQEIASKGGQASHNSGFASMDPDKQREIASKGGQASSGSFEPGSDKAREAGRKGGSK
ncbi:Conidiation-specific protein 10 [Beauveria bassiana]|nr:Conidiation-specific protein 10 [Beauveria bassiana]